jgi:alanine racemase
VSHPVTRAYIDLDNLVFNFRNIRDAVAPAGVIAVVKADAYGHGALAVANRLAAEGAVMFAVARLDEALELRDSGFLRPILLFGRLFAEEIAVAVKAGLRISVFSREDIEWIEASGVHGPVPVHVKVDTGMGRVGTLWKQAGDLFESLKASRRCFVEGIYSHFSTSDEADKRYAGLQLDRFNALLDTLGRKGLRPGMVHMANSGAVLDLPASRFSAVRPGIILYGHYPSRETSRSIALRQVMTLETRVNHVRRLPAGSPVSYGRRYTTTGETRLAVLPIGYADGLRRALTNRGRVLIGERTYPMVGTITMDQLMVEVGDATVSPGDRAVLWGESGGQSIQALDVAASIDTIPYELTCGVTPRVKRVYVGETDVG